MRRRSRVIYLVPAVFALQAVVNILWLRLDRRPWIWDMALHTRLGLSLLDWFHHPSLHGLGEWYAESLQYPPLYYLLEAGSYALLGRSPDVAVLPNFFFLALMLWAVYRIGEKIADTETGVWAAVLTAFFPIIVWLSRVPLIDFALTAWVCWAFYLLLKTDGFSRPGASILFGIVFGLGLLLKWTFVFFLAGPVLLLLLGGNSEDRRAGRVGSVLAGILAAAIASIWYLPRGFYLVRTYFPQHAADGLAEGDPALTSPKAWLFYFQLLVSYQLFLPLVLVVILGILWSVRWTSFFPMLRLVWVWLTGSWLILTLIQNKDPRYTMPLLPALALLAAVGLSRSGNREWFTRWAALAVALAQFVAISFPIPGLPDKVSLGTFIRGTTVWEWQLFSRTYAGFLGPPQSTSWPLEQVMADVSASGGARLFVVPDHPYFSPETLLLTARLRRDTVSIHALRSLPYSVEPGDLFLVKLGDQGEQRTTHMAQSITYSINRDPRLRLLHSYSLPDASSAFLYGSPGGKAARR